jgi:hypothetical protein
MPAKRIKIGDVFSRLTVISRNSPIGARNTKWNCLCECGNTSAPTAIALTSGHTSSCGCYRDEVVGKASITHGQSKSSTYNSWTSMKQRCYYEAKDHYKYYGGRGIKVCDEWVNDFSQFLKDMGERPDGMTLEREDVNGNYCPSNCIWETNSRQGYNTNQFSTNTSGRTGVYLEPKGLWRALIGVENELLYLGSYVTIEEAIVAREAAELKYYGFNKE